MCSSQMSEQTYKEQCVAYHKAALSYPLMFCECGKQLCKFFNPEIQMHHGCTIAENPADGLYLCPLITYQEEEE